MIRVIIEGVGLFLLPFALFAAVLIAMRRDVFHVESWSRSVLGLTVAGLVLVIASLLFTGLFGETHTGEFEPAHMENGRVVPGRFR